MAWDPERMVRSGYAVAQAVSLAECITPELGGVQETDEDQLRFTLYMVETDGLMQPGFDTHNVLLPALTPEALGWRQPRPWQARLADGIASCRVRRVRAGEGEHGRRLQCDTTAGVHNPSMAPSPFAHGSESSDDDLDCVMGTPPLRTPEQESAEERGAVSLFQCGDANSSPIGGSLHGLPGSMDAPRIRSPEKEEHSPGYGIAQIWASDTAAQLDTAWQSSRDKMADQPISMFELGGGALERSIRSPQPTSAAAARRRAAEEVARKLTQDDSAYAICPGEPVKLMSLCLSAAQARDASIPGGTAKRDAWGFGWAMKFGIAYNTPWMRPRVILPEDRAREAMWYALWIVFMSVEMAPSSRTKALGFDRAKPDSQMNAVYGYRNVMRDCGRELADLTPCFQQLRALKLDYRRAFGDMALVRQQAQAFERGQLLAMVTALTSLALIDVPGWSPAMHMAFLVLICWVGSSGMRNDELASTPTGTFMKRSNMTLYLNGLAAEASRANLLRMANGQYMKGKSVGSKCDQNNYHWGAKDMWFVYDDSNPLNFAWRWVQWELHYQCPLSERSSWAAFSPSGGATPFTTQQTAYRHRQLAIHALGKEVGEKVTIHWHRATLISALIAAGKGDTVTQLMVRHKTVEAMQTYLKMRPSEYAQHVEDATRMDVGKRTDLILPETEPWQPFARIESALESELEASLGKAKSTSAPGTSGAKAAAKKPGGKGGASTAARVAQGLSSRKLSCGRKVDVTCDDTRLIVGMKGRMPVAAFNGKASAKGTTSVTVEAFAPSLGKYVVTSADGCARAIPFDSIADHLPQVRRAVRAKTTAKRARKV